MPLQRSSQRPRFSNRQAIVFVVAIALGLIAGAMVGHTVDGLMTGAIIGALLMVAPGVRDRRDPT